MIATLPERWLGKFSPSVHPQYTTPRYQRVEQPTHYLASFVGIDYGTGTDSSVVVAVNPLAAPEYTRVVQPRNRQERRAAQAKDRRKKLKNPKRVDPELEATLQRVFDFR